MIGAYLGMSFTTSDHRILTPASGLKRTIAGRFATHTPIGGKPRLEYLGQETEQVTFTIELNALYGVKPRALIRQLKAKVGKHGNLVLGGERISNYVLKQIDVTYYEVTKQGGVMRASVDLTLEEYI